MRAVTGGRSRPRAGAILAAALGLLAALSFAAAEAPPAPSTVELLQGRLGAWQSTGAVRLYRGAELYGHIDGGAEIFLELGFSELAVATLERGGEPVGAELYRMADPTAALGIYLARAGQETPDPRLELRHTVGRHQLQLVDGPFYLCLDTSEDSRLAPAALADLAQAISVRWPSPPVPTVLDALPTANRIRGSERVIRGPVALGALITLGEGDILSLGSVVTAVAADYAGTAETPGHTLFVATYPDSASATLALAHLEGHLDPLIKLTGRGDSAFEFLDYSGRTGRVRVSGPRLELRLAAAMR